MTQRLVDGTTKDTNDAGKTARINVERKKEQKNIDNGKMSFSTVPMKIIVVGLASQGSKLRPQPGLPGPPTLRFCGYGVR